MAKDLLVNYEGKPSYNIHIRSSFNDFPRLYNETINKQYEKVCIVTDSTVANLYLDEVISIVSDVFSTVDSFVFEAGEASKTLETVQKLYEHLILKKYTRKCLLIALGGGVVGDLTGFTASTFLRGIDFIQMPTTLLSQVDSSIGGKTGVDFNQYKNMVGAFYMPKMVYMNLSSLSSLDNDNFVCGMGEVVKSALIQNKDFYLWLKSNHKLVNSKDFEALEYMVFECCKIKGYVVEIDPKEQGIRSYLNFGHTLGHAIEKLANFSLGHGQCVSLGMVSALYLSNKLGYITSEEVDDIKNTFEYYHMPLSYNNGIKPEDVLEVSKSDKKMVGNKVKFVILKSIGEADSYFDFSDNDLLESIKVVLE